MKLSEAEAIISSKHGYLVHFEHCGNGLLRGDYFPEVHDGDEPFYSEDIAIVMGEKFAKAMKGKACNFYLVRSDNFRPVGEWAINNR